ncbi:hypothetical protein G3I40_45535 [Streptomyces sp. SID14478]|uniref:hypothetical protein n=1 Tax=Streptomyces sp. SID14478 TaxID=2706073 RepID=UPI0013E0C2EE|nr:hypothetical protein [Streptomyces sp. SID14478]NEB82424.1 hypothetical protein [Streptomyces sp. SID14478]
MTAAVALAISSMFALFGGVELTILEQTYPQRVVPSPGLMTMAAVAFAVLAAAVASGYKVKRRWLFGATALTTLPVLMAPATEAPGLPAWATIPGVTVPTFVAAATVVAAISLTRAAPIALPQRVGA